MIMHEIKTNIGISQINLVERVATMTIASEMQQLRKTMQNLKNHFYKLK